MTLASVACRDAPDGPDLSAHPPFNAGSHSVMISGSFVGGACTVLFKNLASRPLSPNFVFHNVPHIRAALALGPPAGTSLLTAYVPLYEHPLVDPQFRHL